jgi:hypothetical protein
MEIWESPVFVSQHGDGASAAVGARKSACSAGRALTQLHRAVRNRLERYGFGLPQRLRRFAMTNSGTNEVIV